MKIEETTYTFPNGETAIIRSAGPEDAAAIKKHREITAGETHFMARCPEYGCNPRAFKLMDGTYRDEIIMVKIFES